MRLPTVHPTFAGGVALAASCCLVACEGTRTVLADAATLELRARVAAPASFANVATRLGWGAGVVPGATVVLTRRTRPIGVPDTAISDATGVATFRGLQMGEYQLTASRQLSEAEIARAGDAIASSTDLTGVTSAVLEDDVQLAVLTLAPLDRGSLVFREFSPIPQLVIASDEYYYYGNYLRVHNNADSAIALAGMLFFEGFPSWREYTPTNGCATFASLMRDPKGIWAQYIYRFPAAAPVLRPGEAALIATDAIDHTSIAPGQAGFPDLSKANLEFIGGSDVDNPLVPNMLDVGPRRGDKSQGHGWMASGLRAIYGLAMPVDLATLERQYNALWGGGSTFVRLPLAAVLDVISPTMTYTPSSPACPPSVLPEVDAQEAVLVGEAVPISIHRRTARTLSNGRLVLQRTRNSAADLFAGPMTPFRVP